MSVWKHILKYMMKKFSIIIFKKINELMSWLMNMKILKFLNKLNYEIIFLLKYIYFFFIFKLMMKFEEVLEITTLTIF